MLGLVRLLSSESTTVLPRCDCLPFVTVDEIRFIKELSDIKTDKVNVEIVLECELSKEGLKVEWSKDSKKIRSDTEYDIQVSGRTHRLVIKKSNPKNVGVYRAEYATLSTSSKVSIDGMER